MLTCTYINVTLCDTQKHVFEMIDIVLVKILNISTF